jgi:hypothetical protein
MREKGGIEKGFCGAWGYDRLACLIEGPWVRPQGRGWELEGTLSGDEGEDEAMG